MVGVPIFVANRNGVVWAALVTGVAAWAIASAVMPVSGAGSTEGRRRGTR
jgi:hypothetical protein